jgi:predicted dehydrogenase
MVLDFGDATFATVHAGYNVLSVRLPVMEFWGSEGALTAPAFSGDEIGLWHQGDADWQVTHTEPTFYDRLGLAAGLPHWLNCIREGKPLVNHARHGCHVLDVLLSAQISAREGRAIELGTTF